MSAIRLLLLVCVGIEVWHIIYYTFLYEKYFAKIEKVTSWTQSYDKLHKHFMEFSDYYVNNQDLRNVLGPDYRQYLLDMLQTLKDFGGSTTCKRKILQLCTMRELMLFLLQQFIEILYWVILFALIFLMPGIKGVILFAILTLLGELQKRFNESKNFFYMNIDSMFCIGLFLGIAFKY